MWHNGKENATQKNDSYLLAYDHKHSKGGVGVGSDPLRHGVIGVGCLCLPLHLVVHNLVFSPRH